MNLLVTLMAASSRASTPSARLEALRRYSSGSSGSELVLLGAIAVSALVVALLLVHGRTQNRSARTAAKRFVDRCRARGLTPSEADLLARLAAQSGHDDPVVLCEEPGAFESAVAAHVDELSARGPTKDDKSALDRTRTVRRKLGFEGARTQKELAGTRQLAGGDTVQLVGATGPTVQATVAHVTETDLRVTLSGSADPFSPGDAVTITVPTETRPRSFASQVAGKNGVVLRLDHACDPTSSGRRESWRVAAERSVRVARVGFDSAEGDTGRARLHPAELVDVGMEGARLTCPLEVRRGHALLVEMPSPEGGASQWLFARVLDRAMTDGNAWPTLRLHFPAMSLPEERALAGFVNHLQRKAVGVDRTMDADESLAAAAGSQSVVVEAAS